MFQELDIFQNEDLQEKVTREGYMCQPTLAQLSLCGVDWFLPIDALT